MTSFTRYKRIISSRFICPCYRVGQSFYRRTYAVRIDLYTKYRHTCSKYVHVILHLHELCLGLIIKKREKHLDYSWLACHQSNMLLHQRVTTRSSAGHTLTAVQAMHVLVLNHRSSVNGVKKKGSHIRNVDGLHTSKTSTACSLFRI